MNHTKGPWQVEKNIIDRTYRIRADLSYRKHLSSEETVAVTYGSEANASLISASPELFDSLKSLIEILSHDEKYLENTKLTDAMVAGIAAIDKAKGE